MKRLTWDKITEAGYYWEEHDTSEHNEIVEIKKVINNGSEIFVVWEIGNEVESLLEEYKDSMFYGPITYPFSK